MTIITIDDWIKANFIIATTLWPLHFALMGLMLLDFITGFAAAIGTRTVSSSISLKGVMTKISVWGVVLAVMILEPILGNGVPLGNIALIGFIVGETISILENTGKLGITPPFALKEVLDKLSTDRSTSVTMVAPQGSKVSVESQPQEGSQPGGKRLSDQPTVIRTLGPDDTVIKD